MCVVIEYTLLRDESMSLFFLLYKAETKSYILFISQKDSRKVDLIIQHLHARALCKGDVLGNYPLWDY